MQKSLVISWLQAYLLWLRPWWGTQNRCLWSGREDRLYLVPCTLQDITINYQVLFTWTDEQNDRATVQHLKKLGVDGVIYDRMDQNNEKPVKESVFLVEVIQKRWQTNLLIPQKRKYASSLGSSSNYSASPKSSPGTSPQHLTNRSNTAY